MRQLLSEEFLLQRYQNGVQFIHPDRVTSAHSVKDLLKLPCNVYWLQTDKQILYFQNEAHANNCQAFTLHDTLGKSIYDIIPRQSVSNLTITEKS